MAQEQAIAALEEEVQALKDARLEERFCWILVATPTPHGYWDCDCGRECRVKHSLPNCRAEWVPLQAPTAAVQQPTRMIWLQRQPDGSYVDWGRHGPGREGPALWYRGEAAAILALVLLHSGTGQKS